MRIKHLIQVRELLQLQGVINFFPYLDIVMYSTASTSATILSNKAGTSAVYDPLEDDVSKFGQEAQAIYETPHVMQAPRAQSDNDKQVIINVHTIITHGLVYCNII